MNIRTRLLAAAAAVALPAAMAGAQMTPPAPTPPAATPPATGSVTTNTQANVPVPDATTTPPVEDTVNRATENADEATTQRAPASPATAAQQAEQAADAVEADATAQAQTQAATPPPATSPAPAEAQAATETQATAQAGPVSAATAADLRTGVMVHDQAGGMVGTIESVSPAGAVVATGTVRAQLPVTSFGRNSQGLVIAMTKTQLEAAVAAQSATPSS